MPNCWKTGAGAVGAVDELEEDPPPAITDTLLVDAISVGPVTSTMEMLYVPAFIGPVPLPGMLTVDPAQ